jgi:hypothetical protein
MPKVAIATHSAPNGRGNLGKKASTAVHVTQGVPKATREVEVGGGRCEVAGVPVASIKAAAGTPGRLGSR